MKIKYANNAGRNARTIKENLIPQNLFLSLTFAVLHFWATIGPQDYLDKAPPYTPAHCMKHN